MASIVRNRVGKYIYLYESVSYRDKNGKPQNHKVSIGKIDPTTGEPVYKPEYLERVKKEGREPGVPSPTSRYLRAHEAIVKTALDAKSAKIERAHVQGAEVPQLKKNSNENPKENDNKLNKVSSSKRYSISDIKKSQIKDLGVFYFLDVLASNIGLVDTLKAALPGCWEKVITLAYYMISTGEPAKYCEDWVLKNDGINCGEMSYQKITELMSGISHEDRLVFFESWSELRNESEYMALDLTDISSYSEFIGQAKAGKGEGPLACLLFGEKSKLPVFQVTCENCLSGVNALKEMLQHSTGIDLNNIAIVMDKDFSTNDNIDAMLDDKNGIRFLAALPVTLDFAKEQIFNVRDYIDSAQNTILLGDEIIRGVTHSRTWNSMYEVYAHCFFNPEDAYRIRNRLYGKVAKLKSEAMDSSKPLAEDFAKYLLVGKNAASGEDVSIRHDVIDQELQDKGWLILISNHVKSASEAIEIYRKKDEVKREFSKLKNCLVSGRLIADKNYPVQNKLFVSFIALILLAHIHKTMSDANLDKSMSLKKLMKILETVKVQYIDGNGILQPITEQQEKIFMAFGVPVPN